VAIAPREDGRSEVGFDARERVLRSMVRSVAEQGYAGTDVSEVIERAGIPPAIFDQLFAGKDECVLAAYDLVVDPILEQVATAYELGAATSWSEGVRRGLEALLGAIADQPDTAPAIGPPSSASPLCSEEAASTWARTRSRRRRSS
jgi:AcrR family transcriptional regulator